MTISSSRVLLLRENSTLRARLFQRASRCYRNPTQRQHVGNHKFQSTVSRHRYGQYGLSYSPRFGLPLIGSIALRGWESVPTNCEAIVVPLPAVGTSTESLVMKEPTGWKGFRRKILKAFRLWRRFVELLFTLAPVAALYPLQRLLGPKKSNENVHDILLLDTKEVDGPLGWYLRLCLYCVEWSGAAVIKLMQWAGSRPDLFGHDFCSVFSRLQDDTTPHSWRHTERVMREAYGDDWKDEIHLGNVIGSGCIGQVYEGTVKDAVGKEQRVAVKG